MYIKLKRVITLILTLVLIFSFSFLPMLSVPADAVLTEAAIIASILGSIVVSAAGAGFIASTGNENFWQDMSNGIYKTGADLANALKSSADTISGWASDAGNTMADWFTDLCDSFQAKGSISSGDTFKIPPEVINKSRSWLRDKYDFTGGNVVLSYDGFSIDGNFYEFTDIGYIPTYSSFSPIIESVVDLGYVLPLTYHNLYDRQYFSLVSGGVTYDYSYSFSWASNYNLIMYTPNVGNFSVWSNSFASVGISEINIYNGGAVFFPVQSGGNYYLQWGFYTPYGYVYSTRSFSVANLLPLSNVVSTAYTTITANPVILDSVASDPITVQVPTFTETAVVDTITVPVISTLTPDMVIVDDVVIDPPIVVDPPVVVPDLDFGDWILDGAGISDKFPFCVPFDLVYLVKGLNASPVAPKFTVPVNFGFVGVEEEFVFDFAEWEKPITVIRWGILLSWTVGLILLSRKVIRA